MVMDIEIRTGRVWADTDTGTRARLIGWWEWERKQRAALSGVKLG